MSRADLTELTSAMASFAAERDWSEFHTAKNLVLALTGEVGELASELQWLTDDQVANLDAERLTRVSAELADVLLYLVRLADVLNIDLGLAADHKLADNARRYPTDVVHGSARKMPH